MALYTTTETGALIRIADGAYIPTDPANHDYQEAVAEQQADPTAISPYVPPAVDLVAHAANKRFDVETGGVSINGAHIQTDRDSQAMITGAYAYAQANPSATISYKAEGGFVSLSSEQMMAIGQAVGAHVQACFAAEAAIDADIASGAITAAAQIDGDMRWPRSSS